MWKSETNPLQFDRNYLTRADIARQHTIKKREQGQSTGELGVTAMGWSHGVEESHRSEIMSRSLSSPVVSQKKAYLCKSFGHTNGVSRLTGGDFAHGIGSNAAHMPGYRGHVPGCQFEVASLGTTYPT